MYYLTIKSKPLFCFVGFNTPVWHSHSVLLHVPLHLAFLSYIWSHFKIWFTVWLFQRHPRHIFSSSLVITICYHSSGIWHKEFITQVHNWLRILMPGSELALLYAIDLIKDCDLKSMLIVVPFSKQYLVLWFISWVQIRCTSSGNVVIHCGWPKRGFEAIMNCQISFAQKKPKQQADWYHLWLKSC